MQLSVSLAPRSLASGHEVQKPRSNVKVLWLKTDRASFFRSFRRTSRATRLADHFWLPPGRRQSDPRGRGHTNATINGSNRPFSRNTKRRTDARPSFLGASTDRLSSALFIGKKVCGSSAKDTRPWIVMRGLVSDPRTKKSERLG